MGTIQPIKGALPIAITARGGNDSGDSSFPSRNAGEAAIMNNLEIYGLNHLERGGFIS